MATAPVRYETKPFDCWPKMKEIRRKHFRHTWEAHDRGDVMIMGIVETYLSLFAGMGDFANPSFGPQFTMMMRNPSEAIKCHEAAAAKGYLLDVCSSMRCHLGQLFRGMSTMNPLGGETKPDFLFTPAPCHSMQKTGQIFARHMGVPYFVIETPYHQTKHAHQYVLDQLQEAIPWMEKVTGREYDDEGLIEAVNNEWDCMAAWSRVNEASMLRPAPVDMRQTHSLRLPLVTMRHKKEVVEYARMVADEVEERGRQGISARGYETARLLHEGIPPFYAIQILRYPASYGAVLVAGGGFHLPRLNEDTMTWENRKTPKEKGFDIRDPRGCPHGSD